MRVTPGRDQLQYMFKSEYDMERVLATCTTDTDVPGCAIVCKSWRSIVSNNSNGTPPTGHIRDVLMLSGKGRICFWAVVDRTTEIISVNEYLMTTGRMMKYRLVRNYQLLQKESQDIPQFYIECGIFSPDVSTLTYLDANSAKMQASLLDLFPVTVNFETIRKALALLILHRESPLTRCASDHTSILLSAMQAKLLIDRAKVNYICGAVGSGKSWIAAALYRMHGRNQSVYICTTEDFVEFLKFNQLRGTLIKRDRDLIGEIEKGTFENKTCIIIDDSRNFKSLYSKQCMKALFNVLRDNRQMALFVFADNEYQAFEKDRQTSMRECFLNLARDLKQQPHMPCLKEIYRNTRKVVSFIQLAIEDDQVSQYKIECAHRDNGDGIECIALDNILASTAENGLVKYLRSVLSTYNPPDIAIFLEVSHSTGDVSQLLKTLMPDISFQTAADFPAQALLLTPWTAFWV